MTDASDKAKQGARRVKERLGEAARGAEQRYQKVAEEMRREAEQAAKAARERMDGAVESLRGGYGKVAQNVGAWSDDLDDYVRDNPGRSLLIAAAAGFVLGLLLRGGRRE
ncbi:MAG TPA: hypothetical protein VMT16_03645 [Thermoanaerobaculia bacterium]|nr:hypothetical protein [Thermoanaerobaculia bacterium]